MTAPAGTFSAASHKTSTLRSPAFASSMIVLAIISSVRSPGRLTAARAIWNATPSRRMVSGSKVWPCKKGLMGTGPASKEAESKPAHFTLSAVKPKSELKRPSVERNRYFAIFPGFSYLRNQTHGPQVRYSGAE